MKVVLLLIFHESDIYNKMIDVQRSYIHNHPEVDAYFVTFKEEMSEDVLLSGDVIYVKGSESYTNILMKTIKSIRYIVNELHLEYDFLVRSNVSTIINLDRIHNYLMDSPVTHLYTGGTIETLRWPLQTYEICGTKQDQRNSFFGTQYAQGTGIILSMDVVRILLSIENDIEYDIVDDVKLGLLIREAHPKAYKSMTSVPLPKLTYNRCDSESVFIRNRSNNRLLDVYSMQNSVSVLYDVRQPNFEKTIHISYKNLESLQEIKQQWLQLNPDYEVELYDNTRCKDFLRSHFGEKYVSIFDYIQDGPIKCDFFRVCVIYALGGVYVDADVKPKASINSFIDDDVYFATCISYNYIPLKQIFNYNPHFIVAKRYNSCLYDTMKIYEAYYDERKPYSYWDWSICKCLMLRVEFDLHARQGNTFMLDNKKYQYIIERAIKDGIWYDFTNMRENGKNKISCANEVVCVYNEVVVLENFTNKTYLK
jgi:hypothetical protein